MIERQSCILITFPTTTAALSMEKAAASAGLPGRLIPLPGTVSAGCGLCWKAPVLQREWLIGFLQERGLAYSEILAAVF